MRILLDSNVLLRLIEPGHLHYQSSVDAICLLRQRGFKLTIVPQVVYEFWSVATRPLANNGLGMSPVDAHSELLMIKSLFSMLQDERGIYSVWDQLVVSFAVKGKQTHDARLAAAAQRHLITHLLTFNTSDFSRYPFLVAVSPTDVASGIITV